VSRGPGSLQRRILEVLAQEPTGYLPWRWLKNRFPLQVRDKTFFRAIRSLRRMGRIDDYTVDHGPGPGLCGRSRYIAIVPVYEVGGRPRFALESDREQAALAEEARRQLKILKTLAAARGIRLAPGSKLPLEGTSVDAYRRDRI
jgi:hypothetical protein